MDEECWYDWFCIVFDVTLHIISLENNAYQAHSGVEDSSLCLSSIPIYVKFRRQCLPSSLKRQSKVCKR